MDKVKVVLMMLVLLLAAASFAFFVQYKTAHGQVDRATQANTVTLQLLRLQGVSCTATAQDFTGTQNCITPLLLQKDFKEDGFGQPDERREQTGFLVIKNINRRVYEAEEFTFFVNRVETQKGCTITGTIDYNVDCRFNFDQRCEKGTVLEVFYQTNDTKVKVFTRNC